jgi:hypothetical protein
MLWIVMLWNTMENPIPGSWGIVDGEIFMGDHPVLCII